MIKNLNIYISKNSLTDFIPKLGFHPYTALFDESSKTRAAGFVRVPAASRYFTVVVRRRIVGNGFLDERAAGQPHVTLAITKIRANS